MLWRTIAVNNRTKKLIKIFELRGGYILMVTRIGILCHHLLVRNEPREIATLSDNQQHV